MEDGETGAPVRFELGRDAVKNIRAVHPPKITPGLIRSVFAADSQRLSVPVLGLTIDHGTKEVAANMNYLN